MNNFYILGSTNYRVKKDVRLTYSPINIKEMTSYPIVVEQTYNAPVTKVWKALTDKEQMKQWYFDLAAFKPEVGFEFSFTGGTEERSYVHLCKITEVELERKLTHTWVYEGFEGTSYVTWELAAVGEKTSIKLTHTGLETFPQDNKDFARENFVGGWNHIVGISLKEFVE
jgi:uncharacterized protein YndB with AHSA1/START domain